MSIDFAADSAAPVSAETMEQIFELVAKMQLLGGRIEKGEELLKELNEEFDKISKVDLPELMSSAQLKEIPVPGGGNLVVKPIIKASLPTKAGINKAKGEKKEELSARLDAGLTWLRDNGAEGMIKQIFAADLGKDNEEASKALMQHAGKLGVAADVSESVHSQTLSAYVREQIQSEDGKSIPMDTFAVFSGSQAEVKQAK